MVGFTFDYQKACYFKDIFEYEPVDQEDILKYLDKNEIEYSKDLLLKNSDGSTFYTNNGIAPGFVKNKLVIFGLVVSNSNH